MPVDVSGYIPYIMNTVRDTVNSISDQAIKERKGQLANKYAEMQNQFYPDVTKADINYKNALANNAINTSRFAELSSMVDATKAMNYSERTSYSAEFLRFVQAMPAENKQIWLSNPQNAEAYMNAIRNVQESIKNPRPDLITPILKKMGYQVEQNNRSIFSAPPSQPVTAITSYPQQNTNPPIQQNNNSPPQTQNLTPDLTPEEERLRDVWASQALTNKKIVGDALTKRANSAIALDKFIYDNQAEYSKRFINAKEYFNLRNKPNQLKDYLRKTPNARVDYEWVKQTFFPYVNNFVKQMEQLSSSGEQRKELTDTETKMIDAWNVDPDASIKYLNKLFKTLSDVSKATISAAEPRHKGVLYKLHGMKPFDGDFIQQKNSSANASPQSQTINGKTYHKIKGKWFPVESQ